MTRILQIDFGNFIGLAMIHFSLLLRCISILFYITDAGWNCNLYGEPHIGIPQQHWNLDHISSPHCRLSSHSSLHSVSLCGFGLDAYLHSA